VYVVTVTSGGDVTGSDLTPVGRGLPRAPVPFFGCGGTPHGRGSSAELRRLGVVCQGAGKGEVEQTTTAKKTFFCSTLSEFENYTRIVK
jgi:hypothetical protein